MKGFKGFKPGLICKDKRYAENTTFEEDSAKICRKGMHFCANPFDVLDYYGLVNEEGELNEFAEVEALDECDTNDGKKYCTKKLRIGAKLSFGGFIQACVEFLLERATDENSESSDEDYAQIGSSGDSAKIGSSGNSAQIGSSGNFAQIGSSGNSAQIGSSGNFAKIGSSGNSAQIGSSGDSAQVNSTGKDSVVMCAGVNSTAKAKKGSWITLAEWEWSDKKGRSVPKCVNTEYVDGERIKEDTYYTLKDGEFVEASNV
jgi:hypothetical protein